MSNPFEAYQHMRAAQQARPRSLAERLQWAAANRREIARVALGPDVLGRRGRFVMALAATALLLPNGDTNTKPVVDACGTPISAAVLEQMRAAAPVEAIPGQVTPSPQPGDIDPIQAALANELGQVDPYAYAPFQAHSFDPNTECIALGTITNGVLVAK